MLPQLFVDVETIVAIADDCGFVPEDAQRLRDARTAYEKKLDEKCREISEEYWRKSIEAAIAMVPELDASIPLSSVAPERQLEVSRGRERIKARQHPLIGGRQFSDASMAISNEGFLATVAAEAAGRERLVDLIAELAPSLSKERIRDRLLVYALETSPWGDGVDAPVLRLDAYAQFLLTAHRAARKDGPLATIGVPAFIPVESGGDELTSKARDLIHRYEQVVADAVLRLIRERGSQARRLAQLRESGHADWVFESARGMDAAVRDIQRARWLCAVELAAIVEGKAPDQARAWLEQVRACMAVKWDEDRARADRICELALEATATDEALQAAIRDLRRKHDERQAPIREQLFVSMLEESGAHSGRSLWERDPSRSTVARLLEELKAMEAQWCLELKAAIGEATYEPIAKSVAVWSRRRNPE